MWQYLTLTNSPHIWGRLCVNLWRQWDFFCVSFRTLLIRFSTFFIPLRWVYYTVASHMFIWELCRSTGWGSEKFWDSTQVLLSTARLEEGWVEPPWSTGMSVSTHGLSLGCTAVSTLPQIPKEKLWELWKTSVIKLSRIKNWYCFLEAAAPGFRMKTTYN